MNIFFQCNHISFLPSVVSIGAFDGLHLAHNAIIDSLKKISLNKEYKSIIFTFEEPPKNYFSSTKNKVITTNQEKIKMLKSKEIDTVFFQEFDNEFANYSAEYFIKHILIENLNMKTLVIGDDHKLGKNQEGNFEKLTILSKKYNFEIIQVAPFYVNKIRVSSTNIRNALKTGNIELANLLLGYNYFLKGTVIEGKKIGRKIGFPTANLKISPNKLLPSKGVYAVIAEINGKKYSAMCNIGYRPSINLSTDETIEVHIINFDENIYKQEIKLEFSTKIRDEIKFNNANKLKKQLKKDKKFTNNHFSK